MLTDHFRATISPASALTTSITLSSSVYLSEHTVIYFVVHRFGSAVTSVTGTSGGTWTRIANVTGVGVGTEIWMGEGLTSTGVIEFNWPVATKATFEYFAFWDPATSRTASVAVTATGSSTAPTTATITPAAGDFVITAETHLNTTQPSARTDTPGGAEQFTNYASTAATGMTGSSGYRQSFTTNPTKRAWTITSAQWAACVVCVTSTAPATDPSSFTDLEPAVLSAANQDAFLYRGLDTKALDEVGVF